MNKPISYTGDEGYIFISYSHKNSDLVWDTLNDLQKDGFRFWYDDGIEIGESWDDNIADHIIACGYFLAVLSEDYALSENCIQELRYAMEIKKPILLIKLDATRLSGGLEMRLCTYQSINYYELDPVEYLDKIRTAECLNSFKPPKDPEQRRYSYKEKHAILLKALKQSHYCQALFIEHEMIDDILFWCLYNMGFLATPTSTRVRDKIRPDLASIVESTSDGNCVYNIGIGTLELKLNILAKVLLWANTFSAETKDNGFKILKSHLSVNILCEKTELLSDIESWSKNTKKLLIDSLKKSQHVPTHISAELAASGQEYAKSLNDLYKEIRKGNKIRTAFNLK